VNARNLAIAVAVSLALVLQTTVFSRLTVEGVAPDLVLLVVAAVALRHGSQVGLATGFAAGLLLDLAPPADHVAGRWALALLVVGYVAGRLTSTGEPRPGQWLGAAAASSFVGTSVFALSGLVLSDPAVATGELLRTIAVALGYDVVLALAVVPLTLALLERAEPDRVRVLGLSRP